MPVVRNTVGAVDVSRFQQLWAELAGELKAPKAFGQPLIREEEFPRTGLVGVTVIWDKLADRTDAERPAIITRGYEAAGLADVAKRLAFAVGYTVPEAVEAGLLPVKIVPLL